MQQFVIFNIELSCINCKIKRRKRLSLLQTTLHNITWFSKIDIPVKLVEVLTSSPLADFGGGVYMVMELQTQV